MIKQSKGKIFLADERGLSENEISRSLNTFNFETYQHVHKESFGNLYAFSENTLAGGTCSKWIVAEPTTVILIPVVGAIQINDNDEHMLEPGMAELLHFPARASYEITNPYENNLIKYIQLWIKAPGAGSSDSDLTTFDLNSYKLTTIFQDTADDIKYVCNMVKLDGRQEDIYLRKNSANGVFVFAIQGALEVQYRLMHEGDGLGLWDVDEVEFEALSNDAILLIMEVALS
jgi:quercetin 2,3-dioxygenase